MHWIEQFKINNIVAVKLIIEFKNKKISYRTLAITTALLLIILNV